MTAWTRLAVTGAATALAAVAAATPAMARQERAASTPALRLRMVFEAPAATVEGELVSVDVARKRIVVKTARGDERIRYTNDTRVIGADKGVVSLVSATGARVTVKVAGTEMNPVATEITLHPKS